MIRVAADAWCLAGPAGYRGVGTYVRAVLGGLGADDAMEVMALAPDDVPLPDGVTRRRISRRAPPRWALAEHQFRLPSDLRGAAADVVWEPTPDPPRSTSGPWVQTLHDVAPLALDDGDLVAERRRWKRYAARYRQADAVIAVSRFSADEGIRLLGLDPARLHVCHHGVAAQFRPGAGPAEAPYVVTVNEYGKRKGYPDAFAAIAGLADLGHPHELRVAGRIAPWVEPEVTSLRAGADRPDRVSLLGFVDDLPGLYQGAAAFVGTSRYEGFGLPALEAMACGIPVVAYANSATSEVVADGGVLVPDGDVGAIVGALHRVLTDGAWADELRARAVQRASMFSWGQAAATHATILRAVAH